MSNERINELVDIFIEKPYLMKMGAPKISKRIKCSIKEVYEVKEYIKSNDLLKQELEVTNKGRLKSRWQNGSGKWLESYKYDDDDSLSEIKTFKEELLNELRGIGKCKSYNPNHGSSCLEISLPDYHFGKIDGTTLEQQAERFVKAGIGLFSQAKNMNIERVLLPIGNDFYNSESTSTTTKGTPQQNNEEFHKIFATGWKSVVALVNALSDEVPVDIIIVPGNHDTEATIMLGEVLEAYYHNDKTVKVDNGAEQIKYYKYGKNFFLYNHGDKNKGADLALRMAVEKPIEFANSTYRFIRLGHFHKNMAHDDMMGIEIEYMPSLTKADKWHRDNNYLSQPKSSAVVFDKNKGKRATFNIYIEHI